MRCPEHKNVKMVKANWQPYDGLDPKMVRLACIDCNDYWYKAPKKHMRRWDEV